MTLALEERAEIQYDETAQSPWFRYTAGDGCRGLVSLSLIGRPPFQLLPSIIAKRGYYYTNMGRFENQVDFYGWKVPFTTKSFIVSYDGVIKAPAPA